MTHVHMEKDIYRETGATTHNLKQDTGLLRTNEVLQTTNNSLVGQTLHTNLAGTTGYNEQHLVQNTQCIGEQHAHTHGATGVNIQQDICFSQSSNQAPIIEQIYEKPIVIQHNEQAVFKQTFEGEIVKTHQEQAVVEQHVNQAIVKEIHQDVIHEHHKDVVIEHQQNVIIEHHKDILHEHHQPIIYEKHIHEHHQPIIHEKHTTVIQEEHRPIIHEQHTNLTHEQQATNVVTEKIEQTVVHEQFAQPVVHETFQKAIVETNVVNEGLVLNEHSQSIHSGHSHGTGLATSTHSHGTGLTTAEHFEEEEFEEYTDEYGVRQKRSLGQRVKGAFANMKAKMSRKHNNAYEPKHI